MADDRCNAYQSPPSRRRGKGRKSGNEPFKRGLNTKVHLAVDAFGMPVRMVITDGTTADCTQASKLIEGLDAAYLLADKAYDSDDIVNEAAKNGTISVIPPRKNRKIQRNYDKDLYKSRHLVENAFLYLKQWRGMATRYAKNTASFLASVHIRCLVLWLNIS